MIKQLIYDDNGELSVIAVDLIEANVMILVSDINVYISEIKEGDIAAFILTGFTLWDINA